MMADSSASEGLRTRDPSIKIKPFVTISREEWTRKVERAVFLYWGSDYDQLIKKGLQRIRDSREFAESLSRYTEQDPCGVARWERLSYIMTEVETRRNEAQPEMAEVEVWAEQLPTMQEGG
jgi:hypothetical protein